MKNIIRISGTIFVAASLYACDNEGGSDSKVMLETIQQKASYSYGVDIASRLKQQGIKLDVPALNQGMTDAFNDSEYAINDEQRLEAKTQFTAELRDAMVKKQTESAATNLATGKAFLEENGKKEGVITTDSGLQYKVLSTGDGKMPKASDTVTTHYKGTLIDGREFDSSYKRNTPASFPVKGVIKGWTEALQLMHVGDKWQLFIPSDLAYGATKRSELIEANSTLIFELELLGIKEE